MAIVAHGEAREGELGGVGGEPVAESGIVDEEPELGGKRGLVLIGEEEAGFAVGDEFRDTADAGGDGGATAGHGLEDAVGEGLGIGGEGEDIEGPVATFDVLAGGFEVSVGVDAKLAGEGRKFMVE